MDILGYVQLTDRGRFDRSSGKGGQTRYKPTQAFLKNFEGVSSTLPKQLIGHEDTDTIVVQVIAERKMKWKDGKPKFIPIKTKIKYTDNDQTHLWRHNLYIINDCLKNHWADLFLTNEDWLKLNKQLVKDKDHDYSPIQLHRLTLRRIFNFHLF